MSSKAALLLNFVGSPFVERGDTDHLLDIIFLIGSPLASRTSIGPPGLHVPYVTVRPSIRGQMSVQCPSDESYSWGVDEIGTRSAQQFFHFLDCFANCTANHVV
jgi:hypothetical protein